MAKNNTLVKDMVANMLQGVTGDMTDLGDDIPTGKPDLLSESISNHVLSEEEKLVIRKARSAKQGRPTNAERAAHEANPQEGKKAIGVQISISLYMRLDKALARTGKTKRDFIEQLLEREFKKLGI